MLIIILNGRILVTRIQRFSLTRNKNILYIIYLLIGNWYFLEDRMSNVQNWVHGLTERNCAPKSMYKITTLIPTTWDS